MKYRPTPPQEELKQLFSYDPLTGALHWKASGKPALAGLKGKVYRGGKIKGRNFYAHRIIWKLCYGEEPLCIDHIDRDPSNNRLSNLRSVTHIENNLNTSRQERATSSLRGVCFDQGRGKWIASLRRDYLGRFDSEQEAFAARRQAERAEGITLQHLPARQY